jgi:hypothetical protein
LVWGELGVGGIIMCRWARAGRVLAAGNWREPAACWQASVAAASDASKAAEWPCSAAESPAPSPPQTGGRPPALPSHPATHRPPRPR